MNIRNGSIDFNKSIIVGDKTLQFVNATEQILNGDKVIRVIDKGFVSSKEYKNNSVASTGGKVYHVTI